MALKLVYGPAGSGKTERAIATFTSALKRGERALFIAPSGPDARHFERQILRRYGGDGKSGVLTGGDVTTFGGYFNLLLKETEPAFKILGSGEHFLLLRSIADASRGILQRLGPSSEFDGFITTLGNLIAEIEMMGFSSTDLAKSMREWAGGNRWRQELNKDIYRLFERYEAVIREQGVYDSELAQRQAVSIARDPDMDLGYETFIVDGFWDFTPAQHELLEIMAAKSGTLMVTLPYQPGRAAYVAPSIHFDRLQKLAGSVEGSELLENLNGSDIYEDRTPALTHLVRNIFNESHDLVDAKGDIRRLTAAGSRGQAEVVAAEILKLWRDGHSLDEIAVVCRSLGPDISMIARVFEEFGIPFELSSPLPLSETTVGKTVLAALDFVAGSRSCASFMSYLRSPLSSIPPEHVDRFDRRARVEGWEEPQELLIEWRNLSHRPLDELAPLMKKPQGAGELGRRMCGVVRHLLAARNYIEQVSAADLRLDTLALRSLSLICDEAENIQTVLDAVQPLKPKKNANHRTGLQLLVSAIHQATVRPPAAVQRNCVRLLDPHRILNQRFDTVFVCGLLEKQFPSLGREDSFFPDEERRELAAGFGVPLKTRDNLLAEERFLYFRTLSRARKHIYLCYPSCDEEGKPNIRSLFFDDTLELYERDSVLRIERGISETTFPPGQAPTAGQALRSLALRYEGEGKKDRSKLIEAAAPAGLAQRLELCLESAEPREQRLCDIRIIDRLGKQESFMVTEIQRYLSCPFIYFVETVLAPAAFEPVAVGLHRGRVIHNILCHFNGQLSRSNLYLHDAESQQVAEVRRQMKGYVEEQFAEAGSSLESLILKAELKYHLDRYIDREIECARPLEYYDVEVSFGARAGSCGGRNSTENQLRIDDFHLRGRLDRIDRQSGSNNAVVIDYKASRSVSGQEKFAEKKIVQIPLYILALG